jgi:hypothetical protein
MLQVGVRASMGARGKCASRGMGTREGQGRPVRLWLVRTLLSMSGEDKANWWISPRRCSQADLWPEAERRVLGHFKTQVGNHSLPSEPLKNCSVTEMCMNSLRGGQGHSGACESCTSRGVWSV